MSRFIHLAHLKDPSFVKAGAYITRGQQIGFIGNTGAAYNGSHLHIECTKSKPLTWTVYPTGLSIRRVKELYDDPSFLFKDGIPCDFTYKGYGWLQWTGTVFHPAIDANSPNDFGKPVFSPVNGRVQFSEGVSAWNKWGRKLLPSFYNKGFGNHLWIEVDEANSGI